MNNNRLMKEYREIANSKGDPEITLRLVDESTLTAWRGFLRGPEGTPYEGGLFELKINCSSSYPLVPPQVRFVTRVFHPNVLFKVRAAPVARARGERTGRTARPARGALPRRPGRFVSTSSRSSRGPQPGRCSPSAGPSLPSYPRRRPTARSIATRAT